MIRSRENALLAYFPNEEMSRGVAEQSTNDLPDDCLKCVFQFLSVRELLVIEQVSQRYLNSEPIKHIWRQLCKERAIPVNWSDLFKKRNDPCPEKFTYRTERALQYFLDDRNQVVEYLKATHSKAVVRKEGQLDSYLKKK